MTITITSNAPKREITTGTNPNDQFVEISLTPKEAIDVYYALDELTAAVTDNQFDTHLPVAEMRNIALGGMHFPNDFNLLISTQEHAQIVLIALAKYDPQDADFTTRLQNDLINILKDTPMNFNIDALTKISAEH